MASISAQTRAQRPRIRAHLLNTSVDHERGQCGQRVGIDLTMYARHSVMRLRGSPMVRRSADRAAILDARRGLPDHVGGVDAAVDQGFSCRSSAFTRISTLRVAGRRFV